MDAHDGGVEGDKMRCGFGFWRSKVKSASRRGAGALLCATGCGKAFFVRGATATMRQDEQRVAQKKSVG